jgi:hypothetical protein
VNAIFAIANIGPSNYERREEVFRLSGASPANRFSVGLAHPS